MDRRGEVGWEAEIVIELENGKFFSLLEKKKLIYHNGGNM